MKRIKQDIRFALGSILNIKLIRELSRKIYFSMAESFVSNLNTNFIEESWIRRSTVTNDFYPLMSDIDITLVIKQETLEDFLASQKIQPFLLIKDLQIISSHFKLDWLETGGFRNRQLSTWKPLTQKTLPLDDQSNMSREILAFELGLESHLLYKQLQQKLKEDIFNKSISSNFSISKLQKELERIRMLWLSQDLSWIKKNRDQIHITDIDKFLINTDSFWKDLLNNLHSHLRKYNYLESLISEEALGITLNLEVEGLPVFLVHESKDLIVALKTKPNHFVTTKNYLQLIKGIGVQEQTFVNDLAAESPAGYYFKYNRQRLAHDLMGAIILEPENYRQLYFCFHNIEQFHQRLTGRYTQHWNSLERTWSQSGTLPVTSATELQKLSCAYLDILIGLS